MYEKHGLMVKLTNPAVLAHLRLHRNETNTSVVERALRDMLGIPPVQKRTYNGKPKTVPENDYPLPVKISDQHLIDYITGQRKNFGVPHCFTVQTAVLRYIERHGEGA